MVFAGAKGFIQPITIIDFHVLTISWQAFCVGGYFSAAYRFSCRRGALPTQNGCFLCPGGTCIVFLGSFFYFLVVLFSEHLCFLYFLVVMFFFWACFFPGRVFFRSSVFFSKVERCMRGGGSE